MGGFWDKVNEISDVLEDVSVVADTANHSVKKTKASCENIGKFVNRVASGDNEKAKKKIMECERKEGACIFQTIIFCVLVILATILFCFFL